MIVRRHVPRTRPRLLRRRPSPRRRRRDRDQFRRRRGPVAGCHGGLGHPAAGLHHGGADRRLLLLPEETDDARSHRSDARGRRGGVAAARGSRSTSSSSSVVAATNPQNSATSEATSEATSVVEVPAAALAAAQSTEDLLQFSLDALKAALMARGVKCGGTHVERVTRLFSIRNLSPDEIDPKLRALAKKEAAATAKPG